MRSIEPTRVQLCGAFAVELSGRPVILPGRQARVLFGYLVVSRHQPVGRDALIEALWGGTAPGGATAGLNALISKLRTATGPGVILGRTELSLALPEPARVDVEVAIARVHAAEAAAATGDWRRAWSPALAAQFVTRRPFLPDAQAPWADAWRRRLADVRVRALESYVSACLGIAGAELAGAERAARELIEVAPLRETGHLLLMRTLSARGNVAEALRAYESLRALLRDELGVSPSRAVQEEHGRLLR